MIKRPDKSSTAPISASHIQPAQSVGLAARRTWKPPLFLFLLLLIACVRGLVYVLVVPPWDHYDEPTHFEYAWLIANRLSLPQKGEVDQDMRFEVASSLIEHRFYRQGGILPALADREDPVWLGISELNHPPLYYLLLAVPLRAARHLDVVQQLYLARLTSLLLYLCTLWLGYRIVREFVPATHPLCWAVPLAMALLPAYTDLMTAVNNDVGAVTIFCLFLWGAVRTVLHGNSIPRMAWMAGTALLCVWTKNTASIALLLLPLAILLALFHGSWKAWWWAIVAAGCIGGLIGVFAWGDAASWYRGTTQYESTSSRVPDAPWGEHAIAITVASEEPSRQVFQYVPETEVADLQGKSVTLGAWIWASQPGKINSPMLYDGESYSSRQMQIDIHPTFYTFTTTLSTEADRLGIFLRPFIREGIAESTVVYHDGIVLAVGAHTGIPDALEEDGQTGTWDGAPFTNLVRNGSAEHRGPRVRPWIENPVRKYARRSPSQFLTSMLDIQYTGWVYRITARRLLESFWARFGWNSIGLADGWYWVTAGVTVLGSGGAVLWAVRSWKNIPLGRKRVWILFVVTVVLLWGNAFVRPHPVVPRPYLPVARYAYPAIVPTLLALAGGWWTLCPRRWKRWFLGAQVLFLSVLDVVSLVTIVLAGYGR